MLLPVPIQNVSITAPALPYKHMLEPQRNVLLNISHSSCNGDRVGLLKKIRSIQNERTMTQSTICNFLKNKGEMKHQSKLMASPKWWSF